MKDQMNEQLVRKIVREEMNKNYRSGAPKVPPHVHNGNDSARISQADITPNTKFVAFAVASSGPFTLKFVTNPTSLWFYGYAANNAGGGSATKRATITGTAQFGPCIYATSIENVFIGDKVNFIQVSNFSYTDESGPTFRVGGASNAFAYAAVGSTVYAEAVITSWTGNSITAEVTLESGWQMTGAFLIE